MRSFLIAIVVGSAPRKYNPTTPSKSLLHYLNCAHLPGLFGTTRRFVGSTQGGNARLTLFDGTGRPRIVMAAPSTGVPEMRVLDEFGNAVLSLPV